MARLIFTNLMVLAVLLLVLECTFRGYQYINYRRPVFDEDRFISPWITSNAMPPPKVTLDGKAYFVHRDLPVPYDKLLRTVRIIAVGGSTTVNQRAYWINKMDYSKALEDKLNANGGPVTFEVLNAGGDGYSTAQSLINIAFRLVEFKPDMILLMHNINDASVNAFMGGASPDYANKYLRPYYLDPSLQGGRSLTGFLMRFRLLRKLGLIKLLCNKSGDIDIDNDYRYGLHLFKRNLSTIARICSLHGIDLVLLSQPYSMEANEYVKKEVILAYNEAIADVARKQGTGFIDMFDKFGHDKKYFLDEFHYTPAGIERFSRILSEELAANFLIGKQ